MRSSLWSSWSTTWLSRYTDVPLHMSNLANAEIPDQSRFFSDALRHHYFFSSPLEWELLKARNCVRSLSIYPASPFHHENLQLYPTVGRKVQWTTITQLQQLSLLCQFYLQEIHYWIMQEHTELRHSFKSVPARLTTQKWWISCKNFVFVSFWSIKPTQE